MEGPSSPQTDVPLEPAIHPDITPVNSTTPAEHTPRLAPEIWFRIISFTGADGDNSTLLSLALVSKEVGDEVTSIFSRLSHLALCNCGVDDNRSGLYNYVANLESIESLDIQDTLGIPPTTSASPPPQTRGPSVVHLSLGGEETATLASLDLPLDMNHIRSLRLDACCRIPHFLSVLPTLSSLRSLSLTAKPNSFGAVFPIPFWECISQLALSTLHVNFWPDEPILLLLPSSLRLLHINDARKNGLSDALAYKTRAAELHLRGILRATATPIETDLAGISLDDPIPVAPRLAPEIWLRIISFANADNSDNSMLLSLALVSREISSVAYSELYRSMKITWTAPLGTALLRSFEANPELLSPYTTLPPLDLSLDLSHLRILRLYDSAQLPQLLSLLPTLSSLRSLCLTADKYTCELAFPTSPFWTNLSSLPLESLHMNYWPTDDILRLLPPSLKVLYINDVRKNGLKDALRYKERYLPQLETLWVQSDFLIEKHAGWCAVKTRRAVGFELAVRTKAAIDEDIHEMCRLD
ncbi:hypothetical protein RQP46_010211 [Phenoliferia psychrophenolica]